MKDLSKVMAYLEKVKSESETRLERDGFDWYNTGRSDLAASVLVMLYEVITND